VAANDAVAVRVEGARELRRELRALGADLGELTAANRRIAELVVPRARAMSPNTSGRGTGRLAESIAARATRTQARISSRLVYAPVIEYGWPAHGIEPTQFVQRAIEESRDAVVAAYQDELGRIIEKHGG
jgi:hypothetical protein